MIIKFNGRDIEIKPEDAEKFLPGVAFDQIESVLPLGEMRDRYSSYTSNLSGLYQNVADNNEELVQDLVNGLAGFQDFLKEKVDEETTVCQFIYQNVRGYTKAGIDQYFSYLNDTFGFTINPAELGVASDVPQQEAEPQKENEKEKEEQEEKQEKQEKEEKLPKEEELPKEREKQEKEKEERQVLPEEKDQNGRIFTVKAEDIEYLKKLANALGEVTEIKLYDENDDDFSDLWEKVKEFHEACSEVSKNYSKNDEAVQAAMRKISGLRNIFSEERNGKSLYDHILESMVDVQAKPDDVTSGFKKIDSILAAGHIAKDQEENALDIGDVPIRMNKKRRRLHMENNYFNLDTEEERVSFIALGATENRLFGEENKGPFSETERETFSAIAGHFFKPQNIKNKKAAEDYDAFNKRIKVLLNEVKRLNIEHGNFIKGTDFSALLDTKAILPENMKLYVSSSVCPEAVTSRAIREYINTAIEKGVIGHKYMSNYLSKEAKLEIAPDNVKLEKKFKEALLKGMTPDPDMPGAEEYNTYLEAEKNGFAQIANALSVDMNNKINLKSDEVKNSLSASIKDGKTWRHPEDSITQDSAKETLTRLNNIYDQFSKTKKMVGGNSEEYKNLLEALNKAHEAYNTYSSNAEFVRDKKEVSSQDKQDLLNIYDNVTAKAMAYLKDKRFKRGTESGAERYEIAFSALALTAKGHAKRMAKEHNYVREYQKVKKVALGDLMERSKYSHENYKLKKKGKLKEPVKKVKVNGILA